MNRKTLLFSVGLLGCLIGGGTNVFAADAADTMPDISTKQISVGYYHNWASEYGAGYKGGRPADIDLAKVNPFYNVISVAFMKGEGIPTFKPYNMSDQEFRAKVASLNGEGRAVLISLGGADSHIELHKGDEQSFANEIIRLVEVYGFDGLDIDLEQTAVAAGDNTTVIPEALKIVRDHYQKEQKHFIISMAPEFPYLRTQGKYVPYITALEEQYDFIAPQLYNQAGDGISVGSEWIAQNNDSKKFEFLYGISKAFNEGNNGFIKIPANRLALGIPANEDAAANGFVQDPSKVYQVFEQMKKDQTPLKGLMTWSIDWDEGRNSAGVMYNSGFAKSYQDLFGTPTPDTQKPSQPTNLRGTATSSSVSLSWQASTDNVSVASYNIYENDQLVGTSHTTNFTHSGLLADTVYTYKVEAVDTSGNKSTLSDAFTIKTNELTQLPAPSVPDNLAVKGVTKSTVSLEWKANDQAEEITHYEVYRDGVKVAESVAPIFEDKNLTAATTYSYQIKAVNAIGTSELTQKVMATTSNEQTEGEEWTIGKAYVTGDIVTYNGKTYRCLQAHTAIATWAPDLVTSLWQLIG
ncbi:chitinase [Enterococcus hirae]|nr:chitinase [Enterococcus hirae]